MEEKKILPLDEYFQKHPLAKKVIAVVLAFSLVLSIVVIGVDSYMQTQALEPTDDVLLNDLVGTGEDSAILPDAYGTNPDDWDELDEFTQIMSEVNSAITAGDYALAKSLLLECEDMDLSSDEEITLAVQYGNIAYGEGNYAEALVYYKEVLNSEQDMYDISDVYFMTARCMLLDGDYEAAKLECDEAIQRLDNTELAPELFVLRGTAYMYLGDYEASIADFEESILRGYSDAEIIEDQIEICEQVLSGEIILTDTETATDSTGSYTGNYTGTTDSSATLEAIKYYSVGNYAQAAVEFEKLIGVEGTGYTDAELYSCIAKCLLFTGDYEGAIEYCNTGVALNDADETPTLIALIGTAYMAQGEYELAAEQFQKSIDAGYATAYDLYTQMAACYYYANLYSKVYDVVDKSIAAAGYDTAAVLWAGLSYYQSMDYENAAIWLERSLLVEQSYCETSEISRCLARSYLLMGDYEAVKDTANTALDNISGNPSEDPSASDTYALRGAAYLSEGDYENALNDFYASIAMGYSDPYELYSQCVLCSFLLGDYDGAIYAGERALDIDEGDGDIYYWIGLSHFSKADYETAYEYLLKAESLDNSISNIYFYLGVAKFSLGDYSTAAEHFTTSIDKGETVEKCTYNRGLCYLQIGEYDKAKTDLNAAANQTNEPDIAEDAADLLTSLDGII